MKKMRKKIGVVLFPGSNGGRDLVRAIRLITKKEPAKIWHKDCVLDKDIGLVFLPGGFSFGDYLRSGAIAARSCIMREITSRAQRGALFVFGICNGFQILTEAGLLPGCLVKNANARFMSCQAHITVEGKKICHTPFSFGKKDFVLPIANRSGRYFVRGKHDEHIDNVFLRYSDDKIKKANGSICAVAGLANAQGNVFGMMPHPERVVFDDHGTTTGEGATFLESITRLVA